MEKGFFTSREAKKLGIPYSLLNYYIKRGDIKRIGRGLYKGAHAPKMHSIWEDLIERVSSVPNGAICLISALAFYGLTEVLPHQHWIAIKHSTSAKKNRSVKLIRMRNFELGKTTVTIEGIPIAIFDMERTIVDAFRLLSIETAIKALRMALSGKGPKKLDILKLEAYARQLRCDITPYLVSLAA